MDLSFANEVITFRKQNIAGSRIRNLLMIIQTIDN